VLAFAAALSSVTPSDDNGRTMRMQARTAVAGRARRETKGARGIATCVHFLERRHYRRTSLDRFGQGDAQLFAGRCGYRFIWARLMEGGRKPASTRPLEDDMEIREESMESCCGDSCEAGGASCQAGRNYLYSWLPGFLFAGVG
jgi:hypothetical protein